MILVHPRVHGRHPEILDGDVVSAWTNAESVQPRFTDDGIRYCAIGSDARRRDLEMVAVELQGGDMLVYHAMTPASDKTYREHGMGPRGRRGR